LSSTATGNIYRKFHEVWICSFWVMREDRQTDIQIDGRRTYRRKIAIFRTPPGSEVIIYLFPTNLMKILPQKSPSYSADKQNGRVWKNTSGNQRPRKILDEHLVATSGESGQVNVDDDSLSQNSEKDVKPTYQHSAGQFIVRQVPAAVFIEYSKKIRSPVLAIFHKLYHFLYWRHSFLCKQQQQHSLPNIVTL